MKKLILLFLGLLIPVGTNTKYHSQFAQDKWLNKNIFLNKKRGTFVDIGAADGIEISNTLFFESELNWNGICVEALPEKYKELKANRSCHCENACIGTEKKEVSFLVVLFHKPTVEHGLDSQLLSGRIDTWTPERLKILDKTDNKIITLMTTPLQEILEKYRTNHIDYLSIDVEGAELEVLESINWNRVNVGVIDIENHYKKETGSRKFLRNKGYVIVKRLGTDDIWVKPEYIFAQLPHCSVASLLLQDMSKAIDP